MICGSQAHGNEDSMVVELVVQYMQSRRLGVVSWIRASGQFSFGRLSGVERCADSYSSRLCAAPVPSKRLSSAHIFHLGVLCRTRSRSHQQQAISR